jgi:predicted nucleotidyltransferase
MENGITELVIETFKRELRNRLGKALREIILFGSQARGDGYPDSDFDMLVIVKGPIKTIKPVIREAEWVCMERHNALVSSIIHTPESWLLAQESPLGWSIRRDGKKVA